MWCAVGVPCTHGKQVVKLLVLPVFSARHSTFHVRLSVSAVQCYILRYLTGHNDVVIVLLICLLLCCVNIVEFESGYCV